MTNTNFKARIAIMFKNNHLKSNIITEYFPETYFKCIHPWETCKIDGCMNCCYETLPDVDPAITLLYLIDFVNGFLSNVATDESAERVKITRKLLAGTRMVTFELVKYCRIVFNIDHTFTVGDNKPNIEDILSLNK